MRSFLKTHLWQIIVITLAISLGAGWYYHVRIQGAATQDTDEPSLQADLTSTIDLQRGIGGPTFTRADGADRRATVTDFEGLIRPVKAGEARFQGARRVENLLANTQQADNASWTKTNVTVTADATAAPDGTVTADLLTAGTSPVFYQGETVGAGKTYVFSVYMKSATGGNQTFSMFANGSGMNPNPQSAAVTVTTSWQRFSMTATASSAGGSANFGLGAYGTVWSSGQNIYFWGAQLEDITGQANQNPSEYVSTNVKTAAPYHGANVDGVKYFTTQNGNTVASNIVTEATGSAISDSTLKGYLAEGSRTNLLTYSEQADNAAWTKTGSTITADAATAPSGLTTADKLVEDSTNGSHYARALSIAPSSGVAYTSSVFVKAGERGYAQIQGIFGGVNTYAIINLSTGTFGTVTGGGTFSATSYGNGWYRCFVTFTTTSTAGGSLYVYTSSDGSVSYQGDGTSGLYIWGAQIEQASFASSYIPTTTATVTRAADSLTYPTSGNMNNSVGTGYAEVFSEKFTPAAGDTEIVIGGNTNRMLAEILSPTLLRYYDGTNVPVFTTSALSLTSVNRIATKFSTGGVFLFTNGTALSGTSTFDGNFDFTAISIGNGGSNVKSLFGTIRNVKIWQKALTDTQLTNMTAGVTGATIGTTVISDAADFQVDLTSTIDLQRGAGGPTFTRADGADRRATVTDFEGLIRPVKAGEARFQGARRVENLLSYSENINNGAWVKNSSPTITADAAVSPDGTQTADRLQATSWMYQFIPSAAMIASDRYSGTVWLKSASGSNQTVRLMWEDNGPGTPNGVSDVTVTSGWQRFSVSFTSSSAPSLVRFSIRPLSGSIDVYVWGAQAEDVTGQANQNPSEYVSTSVKTAAPYHGANVDGVKYFTTQNGNTVASNVVTEATGSAISDSTLKGYLAEGSRTNLATYSEDLGGWTGNNSMNSATANAVMAPGGQVTADKSNETNLSANHGQYQTSSITSGQSYTASIYAKAAEYSWIQLTLGSTAFGTDAWVNFDLSNGTVGNHGGSQTYSITSAGNGWYRCTITATAIATGSNPSIAYFQTNNTDAASRGPVYTGTTNSGLYLWGAQLEQASFASSYIPTTTASVTRANESLSYPISGNFSNTAGSSYAEFQAESWTASGNGRVIGQPTENQGTILSLAAGGASSGVSMWDGSSSASGPSGTATGQVKGASRWSSNVKRVFANGSGGTETAYDGSFGMTSLGVGAIQSTALFGTVRNVKIWQKALDDSQLASITSGQTIVTPKTTINTNQNNQSTSGLVGFWSFNGQDVNWGSATTGTAYDRSGSNNNGTLTNMSRSTSIADGKVGQALDFNGTTQYATIPDNSSLYDFGSGSFTVSAWVKPSALGIYQVVTGKGSNGGTNWRAFVTNSNKLGLWWGNDGQYYTPSTATLSANTWQHVVWGYDASAGSVFYAINGTVQTITAANHAVSGGTTLRIGNDSNSQYYFHGSIDEVRIYNRALSATEISQLYNLGR